jgi:LytTr DNA-binding domain
MAMRTRHSSAATEPAKPERDKPVEGREEVYANGTDRAPIGMDRGGNLPALGPERLAPTTLYLLLIGIIVLGSAVDTWSSIDIGIRAGKHYESWEPVAWVITSIIPIFALLPALRFGYLRIRRLQDRPILGSLMGVAMAFAFSGIHVAAMGGLRWISYPWFGETYRYGSAFENFFYEFRKDALAFVVFYAVFFLNERRHGGFAVVSAEGGNPAELWLRDGGARIRVMPAEILWVASAGNYVEYVLAGGQKHLVRGTLTAEGERLAPLGIVRIHRTRLVNLKRIVATTPRDAGDLELQLDSGDRVVCSRNYREQLPAPWQN